MVVLFTDNQSGLKLSSNSVFYNIKHQVVEENLVELQYVPTGLPREKHYYFCKQLGLLSEPFD